MMPLSCKNVSIRCFAPISQAAQTIPGLNGCETLASGSTGKILAAQVLTPVRLSWSLLRDLRDCMMTSQSAPDTARTIAIHDDKHANYTRPDHMPSRVTFESFAFAKPSLACLGGVKGIISLCDSANYRDETNKVQHSSTKRALLQAWRATVGGSEGLANYGELWKIKPLYHWTLKQFYAGNFQTKTWLTQLSHLDVIMPTASVPRQYQLDEHVRYVSGNCQKVQL